MSCRPPPFARLRIAPATRAAVSAFRVRADDTRYNTAFATEPVQPVTRVEVFLTPPWSSGATPIGSMSPQDGNFSSTIETAQWILPGSMLQPGRQLVYLQANDSAGQAGPVSAVFVTLAGIGVIFAEGFDGARRVRVAERRTRPARRASEPSQPRSAR